MNIGRQQAASSDDFADWLAREMPPGTIISDPRWWAPRILRQIGYLASSTTPASGQFPAPITNHEAWPERYADGFNDALLLVKDLGFAATRAPGVESLRKIVRDMRSGCGCDVPDAAVHGWADGIEAALAAPPATRAPGVDESKRFEEWFADIWAGSDNIPVPEWQKEGWDDYIAQHQLALGAWMAALAAAQEGAQGERGATHG